MAQDYVNDSSISARETTGWVAWWNSEWGFGPLLNLALPLMLSAAFVSLTLFTDRTMLYWKSEAAASASMGAGTLYWAIICLPMGMLGYFSTFVSQYRGAGRVDRIGSAYQHAMGLAWCLVPVLVVGVVVARQIFVLSGHNTHLVELETSYFRILLVGGIGVLFYSVQSGLLTGQGRTRVVLAIDAAATVLNLALDAVLIFGWGAIPGLGIVGAALATSVSFWIKIPIAAWVISHDRQLKESFLVGKRVPVESDMYRRLIMYGAPAGLQMLAEAGCFALIMLQVGKLGELEMAATTLALGLNVLGFVPMIGLGIGLGVLVGQHVTDGRLDLARRSVHCALAVSVAYTGIFACAIALFPGWMMSIYAIGAEPERFDQMRPLLAPLLKIIAVYCILDGLQIVFVGAIKGAGDTWFVLLATSLVSFAVVAIGLFAQESRGASLMLWWYVIASWVSCMGFVFAARFFSRAWERKRVIEQT
ncbi:MAG: MATE family efflux transporter [Pirellulaceae bacterium]